MTLHPFSYHGQLKVPYSKSYLQRAIAISVLAGSDVAINGYTPGKDAIAALSIAEALGAKIQLKGEILRVDSRVFQAPDQVTIHCGEAGLSTRMFSPIAASLCNDVTVSGEGSILVRPMDMVIDALEKLGATVESKDGKLPLHITNGIKPGSIETDGAESSQLLTGLLIALAFLNAPSTVTVTNTKSIPYVQMTLDILSEFGVHIEHSDYKAFKISGKRATPPSEYNVEGDWSGASFHIVGAALNGSLELEGLNRNSSQADKEILKAIELAGAFVEWKGDRLFVASNRLNAFSFDATHCPDLFPPIAALAANCVGTTELKGVSRLASKESNRGLTIQSELKKLGIRVELEGDFMRIYGGVPKGGTIDSHNDHRIAMMGAVMGTKSSNSISILNSEAVSKSYPGFFDDLLAVSKTI